MGDGSCCGVNWGRATWRNHGNTAGVRFPIGSLRSVFDIFRSIMSEVVIKVFVDGKSLDINVDYGETTKSMENDCSIDLVRISLM